MLLLNAARACEPKDRPTRITRLSSGCLPNRREASLLQARVVCLTLVRLSRFLCSRSDLAETSVKGCG